MVARFRNNKVGTCIGAASAVLLGSSFALPLASPLGERSVPSSYVPIPVYVASPAQVVERDSEYVERASEEAVTISSREDEAPEPASQEHETAEPAGNPQAADIDAGGEEGSADEVSRYLWRIYQRSTVKFDSSGDFSWKDSDAAAHLGKSLPEYVIGGMDPDFREQLFAMGQAMDAAGIDWTIRSAFRDDYRQGLASGYKAHAGNSFHGGSAATGGYGHGCAVDLASPDGLSNQTVWNWIDQHAEAFGLHRPLREIDAPHVQPHGAWHAVGAALRHERLAGGPGGDFEEVLAISADQVARTQVTEEQYMCVRPPRPASVISTVHSKSLPKVAVNLTMPGADPHHAKEEGKEKEKERNRDRAATREREKAVAKAREKDGNHHSKAKPKLNVAARPSTSGSSA